MVWYYLAVENGAYQEFNQHFADDIQPHISGPHKEDPIKLFNCVIRTE